MRGWMWIMLLNSMLLAQTQLATLYTQSKVKEYRPVSREQYNQAIEVFEALFRLDTLELGKNVRVLGCLGLEIVRVESGILVLMDSRREGAGFYLLRTAKKPLPMLSIPHRFHDVKTGKIGLKMMLEGDFKAAAFNTVHRKLMDAAHEEYTLFNAFHQAFARVYPDASIYQLHGYNQQKRSDNSAKKAKLIISSGSFSASPVARDIFTCAGAMEEGARLYGYNVFELGGTTNIQNRSLHTMGYAGFVHMEMSREMRERLGSDKKFRKELMECMR